MTTTVNFFYDEQIRRFLLQFIRMVSGFQVRFNTIDQNTGALTLQTVPVMYGDQSRQAAQILRGVSENATSTVPAMAVYISELNFDQDRMQDPFMISKINIRERRVDPETGLLTDQQGDTVTVERPMPMPYMLKLKLDIWTSNTEQKLQLIEQIATVFNPSLEIQSTDNYVDWTSLSYVKLTDMVWDSRTVPMGGEDAISVATLNFMLPIWISPPSRITRMGIIEKMVTNAVDSQGRSYWDLYGGGFGDNQVPFGVRPTSVMNYGVEMRGNQLKLLRYSDTSIDPALVTPGIAGMPGNITGFNKGAGLQLSWTGGVDGGLPTEFIISSCGDGYYVGQILIVPGGNDDGRVEVTEVDVDGCVKAVRMYHYGTGYPAVASRINVPGTLGNVMGSSGNKINFEEWPCPCVLDPNQLGDYFINREGSTVNYDWNAFTKEFGEVRPGLSQIRFYPDDGSEIIGTIAVHPADPSILIYNIFPDTLHANTLRPVEAVIDPFKPGIEKILFDNSGNYKIAAGTRYLITQDIGDPVTHTSVPAWSPNGNPLVAHANDIIEFDGTKWNVSFDSLRRADKQYITNMTTGIQYYWAGESWSRAHDGIYRAGKWSLIL